MGAGCAFCRARARAVSEAGGIRPRHSSRESREDSEQLGASVEPHAVSTQHGASAEPQVDLTKCLCPAGCLYECEYGLTTCWLCSPQNYRPDNGQCCCPCEGCYPDSESDEEGKVFVDGFRMARATSGIVRNPGQRESPLKDPMRAGPKCTKASQRRAATEHAAMAILPASTAAATFSQRESPLRDPMRAGPKCTKATQRRAATEHAAMATLPAFTAAATFSLRVTSPITGREILPPLQIQRHQKLRSLLRQLQYIAYNEQQRAILIRLQCDDCILDPERSLMQCHSATEHMDVESEPIVLEMIAEPLLLTWEQLHAMPAMRKQAGRGGRAACIKQRQLRAFCLEKNIDAVELTRSAYNWRLLLKTMPCLNTPDVIGPGIVGFSFRLLKEIDPNYDAALHVFELNCANGDRWHLHFHQRGNCNRRYLPFEATQPSQ
jgi:hypothetical protein